MSVLRSAWARLQALFTSAWPRRASAPATGKKKPTPGDVQRFVSAQRLVTARQQVPAAAAAKSTPPVPVECHYCHELIPKKDITKDHIVPRAHYGRNYHWNYVPACAPCNQAKADKDPTCDCERCIYAVQQNAHLQQLRQQKALKLALAS